MLATWECEPCSLKQVKMDEVVSYYSCSLSRSERNYCVTMQELLAVVLTVRHFQPYLLGTKFKLRTDHASLTWLLNFKQPEGQVAKWLEIQQEYDFEIQHRPGRKHANADTLSWRPCLVTECHYCPRQEEREPDPVPAVAREKHQEPSAEAAEATEEQERELFFMEELKDQQEADPTLAEVRTWVRNAQRPEWPAVSSRGAELKNLHSQFGSLELHGNVLYQCWQAPGGGMDDLQLLVPRNLGAKVLYWVRGAAGMGHFSNSKTVRRLRRRFYWPGCRQDVEHHVHCCDVCTSQKGPTQRSPGLLQQYLVRAPMERVGVDILGPFPTTEAGNCYILVAMDYFTKWPEAYAMTDQSAASIAQRLVDEMFSRFGVPEELHSDKGGWE
uniref:Gypsy retrotransposon integrase-like protein 1 n=1 Tax=Nothobranchius furzeri TaxID=105023 RepID=A0A8C6KDE8_NOTFU